MDKPIPDLSDLRVNKSACMTWPIDPKNDPCVKINPAICRSYYWHYDPRPSGATEEIFLRWPVFYRLKMIIRHLHPLGLGLLIQDGYRPLSVQRFVQEVSVMKGLKKEYPDLSDIQLKEKVRMFAASADRDLSTSPPPHLTGGAVDMTLVYIKTGKQVDMGKSGGLYNTAFPDALEKIDGVEESKRFRRLLFWLASAEGVVSNPTEWWHFSWGDQMWAWIKQQPYAIYGVAENFQSEP